MGEKKANEYINKCIEEDGRQGEDKLAEPDNEIKDEREKGENPTEKDLRIAYQSILYEICNLLDSRRRTVDGRRTFVTIDGVLPELRELLGLKGGRE